MDCLYLWKMTQLSMCDYARSLRPKMGMVAIKQVYAYRYEAE